MTLEERLREITLEEFKKWEQHMAGDLQPIVDQIIQCFKNDGWQRLRDFEVYEKIAVDAGLGVDGIQTVAVNGKVHKWNEESSCWDEVDMMTGQEWYERFERELEQYDGFKDIDDCLKLTRTVAQRASGIEEKECA